MEVNMVGVAKLVVLTCVMLCICSAPTPSLAGVWGSIRDGLSGMEPLFEGLVDGLIIGSVFTWIVKRMLA